MRRLLTLLCGLSLISAVAVAQKSVSEQPTAVTANPSNAAAEGKANGTALKPQQSKSELNSAAAGKTPISNRNAPAPENGNPTNPRTINAISQPKLGSTMPWLWSGIGIIGALILIGALMSRSRSQGTTQRENGTVVKMQEREKVRRHDQVRRAG